MFIPKTVIQSFRKFANAFLDRPIRKLATDIGIHATANGCTLQVSDAGKSISCSVACKDGDEPFAESVSISCDLVEELAQSTCDVDFGPLGMDRERQPLRSSLANGIGNPAGGIGLARASSFIGRQYFIDQYRQSVPALFGKRL